ncbi:MAG: DNA repair protein RecN [Clostridia bacterium]|nr:DNA repair protein RecN [Clostridia bacterium]
MLQRLKIKNIALIKELELEFTEGLNVLLGETGSGKSIIIDSINFLLGDRADKTLIRNEEAFAKVEGVFYETENKNLIELFSKYGIDYDENIIISRTMSRENKSDIRVNGSIVTLAILKEITHLLVDLCGQNENQFLLKTKNQLEMLDNFCQNPNLIERYKMELSNYHKIVDKIKALGGSEEERNKEIDFLEFQINEIVEAKLEVGEDEKIAEELKMMANIEKISNSLQVASEYFENQQGILSSLKGVTKELGNITQYVTFMGELNNRIESTKIELTDIAYEIKEYQSSLEYSPEEFYKLDSRMDLIKKLQRKYGKTIDDILNYCDSLQSRLDNLVNARTEIEKLENLKEVSLDKLFELGKKITKTRKENAKKLEKDIIEELKNLNMAKTQFQIEFNKEIERNEVENNLTNNGLDKIEFLFSANIGQPLKSLSKIISGGEMSRLMLALKSVLAKCDNIGTLIFDEIDVGISGQTSVEVAKKMSKISKNHQILVVTHSFQVVAMGDNDIFVSKTQSNGQTITKIKILTESEIIDSLTQMLGNEDIKETAHKQAEELRKWSKNYKKSM